MFYHLKIILRNMRRNITYSGINIAGLAIGITASVFIFLWVYNEISFDKYHADSDRIYRVIGVINAGQGNSERLMMISSHRLAVAIKDIPEIENTAIIDGFSLKAIKVNNEIFSVAGQAGYVNEAWFDLFDYKLLEGSFSAFGSNPNSIALTESYARKYFGNASAVGQTININDEYYTVQAVVKDNPSNSSFQWNIMVSNATFLANPSNQAMSANWMDIQWSIYVKLRNNVDISEVGKKINNILDNGINVLSMKASLRPLTSIHFETDIPSAGFAHGSSKIVSLFSILGVLLLLTACINYVNLTTARANVRTKEVGIRKIVGAKRGTLFMQFISESFVVCSIAVLASLILMWILSPFYHLLVENAVLSFLSPVIWVILVAILFAATLLNSIYPALMLSSFQSMNFLKGIGLLKIKNAHLRRGLVVFQFVLSTTSIIGIMIIYNQMQYIQKMDPGYNREQVVSLKIPLNAGVRVINPRVASATELSAQNIKNELQSQACIISVATCSVEITDVKQMLNIRADWDGRAEDFNPNIFSMGVDADYKQTLGLELVEGRWFEGGREENRANVILNETAVREFNIREPYIGQRFNISHILEGRIIGVVKDFHYNSLHEKIAPLVLFNMYNNNMVTFKTQAGQSTQAIQAAKKVWTDFFPNDPFEYTFLNDSFNALYKNDIKTSRLMFIFSALAIIITLLGLFGLSTFAVERRTKEIGIRKILGASVSNIVTMLSKEFLILVGIAILIAFPLAYYWADKFLQDFAYRINIGWWMFALAGIITIVLTLLTVGWQALKAATENPVKAIKSE